MEHLQLDRTLSGSFRPAARLVLLPALRTSGLWATLPPEDFKNLVLLLTYVSPNGYCQPTVSDLAEAMQVSQAKARSRMLRLAQQPWRGRPLVTELPRPDGLDAYAPGRQLLTDEQIAPPEPAVVPVLNIAGRGAVVAHSRGAYAKSHAEVEQEIAERMGWTAPAFEGEDPAVADGKRQAFGRMTSLGMSKEQALDLLGGFDLGAIERQLTWLPARQAKSPARYLAAAIEGDYEMPLSLRRQSLLGAVPDELGVPEGKAVSDIPATYEEPGGSKESPAPDASTIYQA